MNIEGRAAGVMLHITSLPGPHGSGDFGPDAYRFVDWLASAGQRLWQWLPTTPVGPGDSPYQSPSAFAGSPLMVALEPLVDQAASQSELDPQLDPQHALAWSYLRTGATAKATALLSILWQQCQLAAADAEGRQARRQ